MTDAEGKNILQTIRSNLESFNDSEQASNAELKTSDIQLTAACSISQFSRYSQPKE